MKSGLVLTMIFVSTLAFSNHVMTEPALAKVKCSCPSINADGEGNTSCSTSESGGRCSIDYNLFNEREKRAAKLLSKILKMQFAAYGELNTFDTLVQAQQNGKILEQVQLYLSIAAVNQFTSYEDTVPIQGLLAVWDHVVKYKEEVINAFNPESFYEHLELDEQQLQQPDSYIIVDDKEVVITFGCMSVVTPDISVMFKAWSSPARAIPFCRRFQ